MKEFSKPYSPHNTIKEMEVEMILLNLTDEILKSAKEGQEVVEVEMTPIHSVEVVAEEADLIQQAVEMQSIQGHYWTRWSAKNLRSSPEIGTR